MDRIETRTELIDFVCENIKQRAVVRACHCSANSVQVLGGFRVIPPSTRSGWIIAVTSEFNRTWLIAVISNEQAFTFKVRIIDSIPWKWYIGQIDRGQYSIYDGDNPQQACLARERSNAV